MAGSRVSKTRRPLRSTSDDRVRPRPQALPNAPPKPAPLDDDDDAPFDDPIVEQLTGNILQHLGSANSQSVSVRAEIGKLLLDVRTRLPHGAYRPYLKAHVPFTPTTAQRAVNLHHFRQKRPTLFNKLSVVGLAKANVIINLPIAKVEALVNQVHTVPSAGTDKTLLAMTFDEMMEVVSGASTATDPHAALVHDYRRAGRRFIRSLDALVDQSEHIDDDDLDDLYQELRLTLSRFAATFELGPK